MWQKVRIQWRYLVLLVILCFSFTSCSAYDKYSTAWFGDDWSSATPFDESQAGDNNQNAGDSLLSNESGAMQSKKNNSGMPGGVTVTVGVGNAEREKPLLDHYEELLAQLLQDEKDITQLREKLDAHDMVVKKLESSVEAFKAKLEEEERKKLDLEEKNKELEHVIKYTNEHSNPKEIEEKYADEIEKLKVQLVESQIAVVKAKQELIRIKTQYVMDKKKWAQ